MSRPLHLAAVALAVPLFFTACGASNGVVASAVPAAGFGSSMQSGERAPLARPTDPAKPVGNPGFQVGSPGKSTCDPDGKHGKDNNHDGRSHHESCTTPPPTPPPCP